MLAISLQTFKPFAINMVKFKISLLILFVAIIRIQAMRVNKEDQVYRLPVYPLRPRNMTVACFYVSTDLYDSWDQYPANVFQFLLSEAHGEGDYDEYPSSRNLNYFSETQSIAFTKAVAYGRIYQMYSEYLYWLDNVYTVSQSVLHQVHGQLYDFDENTFDDIFLKGSFISIYYWSQSSEIDFERLSSFLDRFPGILYMSLKNDSVANFDQASMEAVQPNKIAEILSLFEDDPSQITDRNSIVQEFVVSIEELLHELDQLFIGNDDIEYPVYPPYRLERDWQGDYGVFERKSSSVADYQNFYLPDFTICGVESHWKLPGLVEMVLLRASDELFRSASTFASFVKYELEERLVLHSPSESCIELDCWRREPETLMAMPVANIDYIISETCFSVYFVAGTLTPNLRIGAPTWLDEYLKESVHDATTDDNGYKAVYTLGNLHKAFERAFYFINFVYNLKGYVEGILKDAPLQPQTKIPKEFFYRDFMEMGYYILQRNIFQFPDETVNKLATDLFNSYLNIVYPTITNGAVSGQLQLVVDVDSISHNLLVELDLMMRENYIEGLGSDLKLTELSTQEYPQFRNVYNEVKLISESLENYDHLFTVEESAFQNNYVRTICRHTTIWNRRGQSDSDEDFEEILDEYSKQLNDAALIISTAVAKNIRTILQHKLPSDTHCNDLTCDVLLNFHFPLFEPLTIIMSQPCVSPRFVGWMKEPVVIDYIPASVLELLAPLTHTDLTSFFFAGTNPLDTLQQGELKHLKMNVLQIIFGHLGQYAMWLNIIKSKVQSSSDGLLVTEGFDVTDTYFQRLHQFRESFSYIGYQGLVALEDGSTEETKLTHNDFLLKVGIDMFNEYFVVEDTIVESHIGSEDLFDKYRLNIWEIFLVTEESIEISNSTVIGRLVKNVTSLVAEKLQGRSAYKLSIDMFDIHDYMDNGIYVISVCPGNVSSFSEKQKEMLDAIDGHLHQFSEALLDLAVELYKEELNEAVTVRPNGDTNQQREVKEVTESGTAENDKKEGRDDRIEPSTVDIEDDGEDEEDVHLRTVTEESNKDDRDDNVKNADDPGVTETSNQDDGTQDEETKDEPTDTGVTEGTEGDRRNNEDQTEETPEDNEKEQYRASYVPSPDQVFMFNGDAKEFEFEIIALEQGFREVEKEDITFTIDELRSFRNQATVTMTVVRVTFNSIIVAVSIDASAAWSSTITIKDQRVLEGLSADPLKIDLTVEHSAPVCEVHRFTDSGNAIKFEFNVPVGVREQTEIDCADFFEDVSSLGDGATCDMKTPQLLLVTIGRGLNLVKPGDTLVFKPNTVNPARQMFYQSLQSEEFSIDPPDNQQELSFTIDGPTRINRCGTYHLRAEQIAGHGGRPVTYRWQPYQSDGGGQIENLELFITQNGLNGGRGSSVLPIDAADLTPGEQYAFSLEITNFLEQVHTEYHALLVQNHVSPVVQIKPVNFIPSRVRASSRVKLEVVVTYSFGDECQSNENVPSYVWTDTEGVIPKHLSHDRILVLPPNTLPVDETIRFTVTVTSIAESDSFTIVTPVTVIESLTLTTVATPLKAEIGGANKLKLGPQETIELDGSRSNDPDGSEDLNYQWDCFHTSNEESCRDSLEDQLNTPKLSLQTSRFQAGTYTISLTVSKDSRRSTASVTVTIADDSVPMIKLKTRNRKIRFRDDESISIQANIATASSVSVTWRESNDRLDSELWEKAEVRKVRNKDEYRTHVTIPADQTTPGSEYTIEVIATDQNGKSGVAAFDISIYQTITQCEVEATPYTEMQEMTLTATGCVTDPESEPLTYQPFFALPLEDGDYKTIILDGSKGESSQTVIATPIDYNNENVLVGFKVCDASLACIDALTTTLYQPTPELSDAEQDKFISEQIDQELDKGNVAKAFSNAINLANMQKKSLTLEERRKKRNIVDEYAFLFTDDLNAVLLVVDQLELPKDNAAGKRLNELSKKQAKVLSQVEPVDSDEGAVILDLSSQMMQSTFNEAELDTTLNAVDRIFKKAKEEGFRHKSETIERALTTLGSTARNLKETSSIEKRTMQRRKISELRKAALAQAGHDLSIGDYVTFNVSNRQMSIINLLPTENEPIDESAGLPVKITPGGSLSERYVYDWCAEGDELCSGFKMLVMEVEDLEDGTDKCSDLTDITLLNPVTDEEQVIQDLEDPIEIEMTQIEKAEKHTCVCKYWNEETSQLDSEGVTSEATDGGKLVCKSNHLTTFVGEVVIHLKTNTDPSATEGFAKPRSDSQLMVILGVVFGVLLVIVGVILVGGVIFKMTQKKKVTPDGE